MLANRHISPGVDTILFKTHFAVVTDAIVALRFPVKSNKFPHTVNMVSYFSYFYGFNFPTLLIYLNFLYFGTCVFEMKINVLVPLTVLVPWVNFPSSFSKYRSNFFLSLS